MDTQLSVTFEADRQVDLDDRGERFIDFSTVPFHGDHFPSAGELLAFFLRGGIFVVRRDEPNRRRLTGELTVS